MSSTFCKRVGWGLLVGGLVILTLTAAINYFQGDMLGVSAAGKWINSIGSVTIDVVGIVACGMAAGACWAAGRWGWGLAFSIALAFSVLWSANSILSYQAAERISASKSRATEIARAQDADQLSKDSVTKITSAATKAKTTTAREDFMYGVQDLIKGFREAKVQVTIEPDAGAQWWASLIGWRLETVQLTQSTYFALVLIFLKSICFSGSGFFLSWKEDEIVAIESTISPSKKGGGGSDGGSDGSDKSSNPKAEIVQFPAQLQAQSSKELSKSSELQPPQNASDADHARVLPAAPKLSASDRVRKAIAEVQGQASLQAIVAASGASLATVSRVTRDLEGKGKLKRSRKGREFQVARNARLNGASLNAFG